MIVVIGTPRLSASGAEASADGLAAHIARAAAGNGAGVEFIGKVGDDPAGDALVLALADAGVGHVATLRDPARSTAISTGSADVGDAGDALDALDAVDAMDEIDAMDDIDPGDPVDAGDEPDVDPGARVDEVGDPVLEPADVALALRYVTDYRVVIAVHVSPAVVAEAVAAANWAEAHLIVVVSPPDRSRPDVPKGALVVAIADDGGTGVGAALGRYAAGVDRGEDAAETYAILVGSGSLSV